MSHYKYKFPTLESLAQVGSLPHACEANVKHSFYRVRNGSTWFCADRPVYEWSDIAKHLRSPLFQAGVDRIQKIAAKLTAPSPKSRRRRPVRAAAGDELDIQRVWQGDLDTAWRTTRREQSIGPSRVLLVVDAMASASTESNELAARGAAVLALADLLCGAGYAVQIVAACEDSGFMAGDYDSRYSCEVTLLEAGQVLDLHKLASLIASGLLLRGVILDHIVRIGPRVVTPGIGHVERLKPDTYDASGFDYVAVCNNHDVTGERTAESWVKQHLAALSGE